MRFTVESLGKVASRVKVGDHEWVFDQPQAVAGGENRGSSPLDVMVAAVAACAHYYAAAYLHGRGLPTVGLAVEVEAEKERTPARLGRFSMRVHLPAGTSDRQVAGVERAVRSCPAYGTLIQPPTVELSIDVAGTPSEEKVSA